MPSKGIEAIIQSMTPRERTNPEILNTSRRQRIAKGSGHQHTGSEPPHQTVRPDAQNDENGDGQQNGQDDGQHAQDSGHAGNA